MPWSSQHEEGDSVLSEEESPQEGVTRWLAHVWKFLLVSVIIAAIVVVIVKRDDVHDTLNDFLDWVARESVLGPLAFIVAYIVATVAFVPGLILTLGAGYTFGQAHGTGVGVVIGSVVVFVGATVGSILAFLLGRYVFRGLVEQWANKNKTLNAIDKVIGEEGLKLIILLRLSPVIPFNAFNYLIGLTAVSFKHYSLGSIGMLPGTIVFVWIGTALSSIQDAVDGNFDGGVANLILLIGGTIGSVAVIVYISIRARKALKDALGGEETPQLQDENEGDPPTETV